MAASVMLSLLKRCRILPAGEEVKRKKTKELNADPGRCSMEQRNMEPFDFDFEKCCFVVEEDEEEEEDVMTKQHPK